MSNLYLKNDLKEVIAPNISHNVLEQIKNKLGSFSAKNEDQRAADKSCWFLNKKNCEGTLSGY